MFTRTSTVPSGLTSKFPIIQAVLNQDQEGDIYYCHDTYFVAHNRSGFCQFFGNADDCQKHLSNLFSQGTLPQYFHLYDAPKQLVEIIVKKPDLFNIKLRNRIQLEYLNAGINIPVLKGFNVLKITEDMLNSLEVFGLELNHKFWSGGSDFATNSMGYLIVNPNKQPVSICYSVANALNKAEIDVMTIESHQGKGLAKHIVKHFINCCVQKGITPNWDCFESNKGSLKIALSLNFTVKREYKFASIYRSDLP